MKQEYQESAKELRSAYQAALELRRPPDGALCPDPEDILALVEIRRSESQRLELLDHVMQCPTCRREFDLLRALDEARPRKRLGVRPWMAAAASVAILFGTGYGAWKGMGGEREPVMRGAASPVELLLLTPEPGPSPAEPVTFLWRSHPEAFEYVLEILDEGGRSLLTHVAPDTAFILNPGEHPTLRGELTWWVRARLRDGTEGTSEVRMLELPAG